MPYFEVVTKCGHVGRHRYYRGVFYLKAENGKEAARIARELPRVKKDHKDAILECNEISEAEYKEGLEKIKNEIYFQIKGKKVQKKYWDEINDNIYPETKCQWIYRGRHRGKKKDKDKEKMCELRKKEEKKIDKENNEFLK